MTTAPLHSKLGPSKAEQWVNCTRSTSFIEDNASRLPPDKSSEYADEGTVAHDVAVKCLRDYVATGAYLLPAGYHELDSYLSECVQIINEGGDLYLEERVPLWYHPVDPGTVDFGMVSEYKVCVRDLKWGVGEYVECFENLQIALYASSLIYHLINQGMYAFPDDTVVDMGIAQPRTYRDVEDVRTWVTTWGDLKQFLADRLIQERAYTALHAWSDDTEFNPSRKTCLWCPAKAICPAYNEPGETGLPIPLSHANALDILPAVQVEALSDEQILRVLEATPAIKNILSVAHKFAAARAAAGNPIVGTKVVLGRAGDREWANEMEADKLLTAAGLKADQKYVRKLVSVAQAEKILKPLKEKKPKIWKRFESSIYRSEGKAKLVLESDPRPALADATAALPTLTDSDE